MSEDYSNETNMDYDTIVQGLKTIVNTSSEQYKHEIRMTYLIGYWIVIILGVILNLTVIGFSCRKHKSFQNVAVWIMALAVTHLVSCISVVFQFLYAYNEFEWNYGNVCCKLSSYITYGSMFFTATMLSLWNIEPIILKITCSDTSNNCNTTLISFSWTVAAVLACPSLFSREVRYLQCIDDYDLDKSRTTQDGTTKLKTVVVMRFLLGIMVPALVMFLSWCKATPHKKNNTQIIWALQIAYFVCWGPQIVLTMLQATVSDSLGENMSKYGLPAATVLATTHLIISPLVYLLPRYSFEMEHNPDHIYGVSDEREMSPLHTS